MTTDAIITLESLYCHRESDPKRPAQPYIWPVLLWTNDKVLASRELVGLTIPTPGNARVVIKQDMRAGERAEIPRSVGALNVRFDGGSSIRRLLLAVAVLEKDEAPEAAIRAGFQAYSNELRNAVAENLLALVTADQMQDRDARIAARDAIIEKIKPRVVARVRSAIDKNLNGWQKARAFAGTLRFDDFIGSDFINFPEIFATSINLVFRNGGAEGYEIRGSLEMRAV